MRAQLDQDVETRVGGRRLFTYPPTRTDTSWSVNLPASGNCEASDKMRQARRQLLNGPRDQSNPREAMAVKDPWKHGKSLVWNLKLAFKPRRSPHRLWGKQRLRLFPFGLSAVDVCGEGADEGQCHGNGQSDCRGDECGDDVLGQ